MAAADVFACAGPDRVGIVGIDREATYRVGTLAIEDRFPRNAGVRCFPDTAAANRDIPGALVRWIDDDVGDAPRHEGRPDAAKFQAFEGRLVEAWLVGFIVCREQRRCEQ